MDNSIFGGRSIGPEGVRSAATIGCIGVDRRTQAPLALTVMHLITDAGLEPNASLRFVTPNAGPSDSPTYLGKLWAGSLEGIDAAAIELDSSVAPLRYIQGIGEIRGGRALTDSDSYIAVRMFGAATGELMVGRIESPNVPMPSLRLTNAIVASIGVIPGDSGAAIVDNDGFVLGLLKGYFDDSDRLAVFTSIASITAALDCEI